MKRFTDTEKWNDPWFRKLPPKYKAFWTYLVDRCDLAGIWNTDFELASVFVGEEIRPPEVTELFKGRLEYLPSGRIYLSKFIEFQYGVLKPQNPCHKGVIKSLIQNNLKGPLKPLESPLKAPKGLASPLQGLKDKDKDKYMVKIETEYERESEGKQSADPFADLPQNQIQERSIRNRPQDEAEVVAYCLSIGLKSSDGNWFWDKMVGCGWRNGSNSVKDWKATLRAWKTVGDIIPSMKNTSKKPKEIGSSI